MKSHLPKKADLAAKAKWYVIDATGHALGKVAERAARILAGKHRVDYTPQVDLGDGIIVINAGAIALSGKKAADKSYFTHSGYKGNIKEVTAGELRAHNPARLLELAVSGMLPKNKLRDGRLARLKVYAAAEHPHAAQNPVALSVR